MTRKRKRSDSDSSPSEASKTVKPNKRKRKSLMNSYLHCIVIHLASFYEKLDFKNSNSEREEGFFSFMREILMSFTNRNFKKASLFREVFVRHWFEGDENVKVHMHNLHGKISKLFADHDRKEVEIINDKPDEVQAFLDSLRYYGYKEGEDWTTVNGSPVFQTLDEVREVFSQHG